MTSASNVICSPSRRPTATKPGIWPLPTYAIAVNSSNDAMTMTQVEQLIQQIRELKLTIKLCEEDLKGHMATLDEYRASGLLDHYEAEDGSFYVLNCRLLPVTRSTWAYSKAVKELQEQEKVSGAATRQESTYLRFEMPKPDA
ncbi:hypothetical protein S-CBS3_gp35 [Synechococcus phage S-CBS3]|uniref:hypothetical protein n=1 Tax=Synechococcus phage S-CBS3 TaxID=753085 RepID=UPI0002078467|nr:hypothetical protein S-CBS3_gp35 [Synechococcus phage S-CBS3]ADF42493.1 hypothetical protein S-CBS3_gp35 [Synechococcus phage S-CBS3]